ncbi:MAG: uroporphyrinogen decarboxylase family protein [Bacillota bacterium]
MPVLQLRSHIPLGSPLRREPAEGTESPLRVVLGFEPAWFHRRLGIDFSARWHQDPLYRFECLTRMKAELHRLFPFVPDWDLSRQEDCATISGCYGAYVIPAAFGFPLRYAADRWPVLDESRAKLTPAEIERLDVESVLSSPFVSELFTQMEAIASRWGKIHGYLNWQGVLNNAFHLRGQDLFLDMYDRPDLVHHLLGVVCEVMIRLARMVQERQRRSGFIIDQLDVSNCTINMISPAQYREFVYPYDKRIAESFMRFGVHTCNWDATPYLSELARLPKVGYIDMGLATDLALAKRMFPEARRAVLYSPVRLLEASLAEIEADMTKIWHELAPCEVVMADIQAETPDDRVVALYEICRRLVEEG